ncbi:AMP-binding protein [Streptodolium elevatio]|uniref:AMP-binding protein n=1 Tax=Streptodolium elevatio TaxID=3157996 RepID=A0ABV3DPA9_9ACTN
MNGSGPGSPKPSTDPAPCGSESHPVLHEAATLWELVERRAKATPDRPFLLDEERRFCFGEITDWAERVAAGYLALGIGAGTRVTWQLTTRVESIVVSLALARLGAVQNPVIPFYREREVGFCLDQTRAQYYICPGTWKGFDFAEMAATVIAKTPRERAPRVLEAYDRLPEGDPATLPPPPSDGDEVRWLYYTSGTTSDPKGVCHTDRTLVAGAHGLAVALEMADPDVGSLTVPFAHIAGPDYIIALLLTGLSVVVVEHFEPASAIPLFERLGVSLVGGSTAFYNLFLAEQRKQPGRRIIPTLRVVAGGGAPKPPELFDLVRDELGAVLCHGYGMTEAPMIAQGGPGHSPEQLANSDGAPVVGMEIRIVASDGTPAAPGEEGEITVRGPMLFKGYTNPALNEVSFDKDGFYRTGDLGRMRPDGHITVTGRLKDVIIRKGENISAQEVEELLFGHPKIADVAVVGIPDDERGERVCAVVERAAGQPALTFDEMASHLRGLGLMAQKIPEQLEVVDALPRSETLRKVLKYKLRERYEAAPWSPPSR